MRAALAAISLPLLLTSYCLALPVPRQADVGWGIEVRDGRAFVSRVTSLLPCNELQLPHDSTSQRSSLELFQAFRRTLQTSLIC